MIRKFLRPYVKFVKKDRNSTELIDRIHNDTHEIEEGQFTIVLSHKNLDNIAKYHILNTSSNLYFNGSLPKTGEGQFKYSDFKFSQTVHLVETETGWQSRETDASGNPILSFLNRQIQGTVPPYKVEIGEDTWYLEQDQLIEGGTHALPIKEQVYLDSSASELNCHVGFRENGVVYPIPTKGNFKWAHKYKSTPEKYLDYLYIKRGRLAFKVSEESTSFADAMSMIPSFYVDEATKNKLADLNDVQILNDFSTFIHQSEEPRLVKDCSNFNPLPVDAILKYGVEMKELRNTRDVLDEQGNLVDVEVLPDDNPPKVICTNVREPEEDEVNPPTSKLIELNNFTNKTRLELQLEDGEVDDCLKIYTNYVRVEDGHGDFHYDLYFNIQNLFNSPFEYISSVTKQPNVLIIPDSYLYLTGDKYKEVYDEDTGISHNVIDNAKMDAIKQGGELSIYGQVKVYSNDMLSDTRTIKLFAYKVYNVSDDKPKFLIEKTYDVTKATLQNKVSKKVKLEFTDVLWQIDENQFEFLDGDENKFRILNQDVTVVQPIHVRYDWKKDDDYRIRSISFDITNDIIDFGAVPELCEYSVQARTLRNDIMDEDDRIWREPHYDHWSDRNMSIEVNEVTKTPRLTLTFPDGGYNFETIYLRWRLPKGCRIMDIMDRLQGYVFSSTANDVVVDCGNPIAISEVETTVGHIVVRVKRPGTMYLGLEHSTTKRMNGYVIANLAEEITKALKFGDFNPTLDVSIEEDEVKANDDYLMVTFDANGGKFTGSNDRKRTRRYEFPQVVGELPSVQYYSGSGDLTQYSEFAGWYTQPEGGEQVNPETHVGEDVTYYAHWNRYLYYTNQGGCNINASTGAVSGFAKTKYLLMTRYLNLGNYDFDLVMNATTSGDVNAEQEVFGCNSLGKDIEFGVKSNKFHWECGRAGSHNGSAIP